MSPCLIRMVCLLQREDGVMKRILLTGMSGTGKSTVIRELAARGYTAVDADGDEFSQWVEVDGSSGVEVSPVDGNRDWVWREERMQDRLSTEDTDVLFVSGCAENMPKFFPQFDLIVLLSAPASVLVERLRTRTTNQYGKGPEEVARVLSLVKSVEPRLRRAAAYEIDTSAPLEEVVVTLLRLVQPQP
jgi:shikimate kinase